MKCRDQIPLKEIGPGGERDRVAHGALEVGGVGRKQRKGFRDRGRGVVNEEEDQGLDGGDGHSQERVISE